MNQIGQSNADNPAFQGVYYDPNAPAGRRFSQADLPISNIPRMYHSVATLTPNATIMIAGSNPNLDVSTNEYGTEYRVEWLTPSYLKGPRPMYTNLPSTINFGTKKDRPSIYIDVGFIFAVALIDLGFVTHGVHMDQRHPGTSEC